MVKFRDGLLGPTVILFSICLVIAFALAQTYTITAPIIEQANADAANEARARVLPGSDTFTLVAGKDLPEGVLEAYIADNDTGFVFKTQFKGFGGPVTFYIGVDGEGRFTGIDMFENDETPGLGSKVGNAEYLSKYYGGSEVDSVDAVTGATITSTALKNALRSALEAYGLVKEGN